MDAGKGKAPRGGKQQVEVPPTGGAAKVKPKLEETIPAIIRAVRKEFTNQDERNALVMDLLASGNTEGVGAILAIEDEKSKDAEHPLAENRFAKVLSMLVADARVRFAGNPRKFRAFMKSLLERAKSNPQEFRLLLELSDANGAEQVAKKIDLEAGKLAQRLNEWYGTPSWVRREKDRKGISLIGAYLRELFASAIEAMRSKRTAKGGAS